MTFPRVRSPGMWTLGSVLAPAEMEEIDRNLTEAIDGAGGGTYAPTAPVVIGASGGNTVGLHVTSHAILDNFEGHVKSGFIVTVESGGLIQLLTGSSIQLDSLATVNVLDNGRIIINGDSGGGGAQFIVAGRAFFNGGSATIFNGTLGNNAGVTFGQYCGVDLSGPWTMTTSGSLTVNRGAVISVGGSSGSGSAVVGFGANSACIFSTGTGAQLTMNSGTTFAQGGDTTRTGKLIRSGNNAHEGKRRFTGPDTDWTVPTEHYDTVKIPSVLTGARTWTLDAPSDVNEAIEICVQASVGTPGFDLTLKYAAATLATFVHDTNRPAPGAVWLEWDPESSLYRIKASTTVSCTKGVTFDPVGSALTIP